MPTLTSLESRYQEVLGRVGQAAERSGRRPEDVFIVAVTKNAELDQIRELVELGHVDFGENRVQQLVQRSAILDEMLARQRTMSKVARHRQEELDPFGDAPAAEGAPAVRWHMIGHLQRNKVKKVLDIARLIHSVDSLRLVEEIQTLAFKKDKVVDVLVQVNCSGESQKYGCAVAAAHHLCEQIDTMVHLRVRGLMTIAPNVGDPADARSTFERCADLFQDIRRQGVGEDGFNILSMGMTNDFEVAIECGANLVRIGRALFGEGAPEDDGER